MLHLRKRLHADIKPDNFVLCIEEDDLKVIDFDSAHKAYTRRSYSSCIAFSDNEPTQRDIIPYDMYTYSFIIAVLFPESFKIEKVRQVTEHGVFTRFIIQKITPPEINAYHQAVLNLFDAIYIQEAAMRCTSKDAIDFFESALAVESLQFDSLADITQDILFRENLTVDDVLCDSERPLFQRK